MARRWKAFTAVLILAFMAGITLFFWAITRPTPPRHAATFAEVQVESNGVKVWREDDLTRMEIFAPQGGGFKLRLTNTGLPVRLILQGHTDDEEFSELTLTLHRGAPLDYWPRPEEKKVVLLVVNPNLLK